VDPTLDAPISTNPHVVFRNTVGGAVLLDMQGGGCWELNVIGAELWSRVSLGHSVREAIDHIADQYEVPRDALEADVLTFLDQLMRNDLLKVQRP
jgi:hypothetical protein